MTKKDSIEASQSSSDAWPVVFVVPFVILLPKYASIFPVDFSGMVVSAVLAGVGGLVGFCSYLYTEPKSTWMKLAVLFTLLFPTFLGLRFV